MLAAEGFDPLSPLLLYLNPVLFVPYPPMMSVVGCLPILPFFFVFFKSRKD